MDLVDCVARYQINQEVAEFCLFHEDFVENLGGVAEFCLFSTGFDFWKSESRTWHSCDCHKNIPSCQVFSRLKKIDES